MKKIIITLLIICSFVFAQWQYITYRLFTNENLLYTSGDFTLEYQIGTDIDGVQTWGSTYNSDNSMVTLASTLINSGWFHVPVAENISGYNVSKFLRFNIISTTDTITSKTIQPYNKRGSFNIWINLVTDVDTIIVNSIIEGQ